MLGEQGVAGREHLDRLGGATETGQGAGETRVEVRGRLRRIGHDQIAPDGDRGLEVTRRQQNQPGGAQHGRIARAAAERFLDDRSSQRGAAAGRELVDHLLLQRQVVRRGGEQSRQCLDVPVLVTSRLVAERGQTQRLDVARIGSQHLLDQLERGG